MRLPIVVLAPLVLATLLGGCGGSDGSASTSASDAAGAGAAGAGGSQATGGAAGAAGAQASGGTAGTSANAGNQAGGAHAAGSSIGGKSAAGANGTAGTTSAGAGTSAGSAGAAGKGGSGGAIGAQGGGGAGGTNAGGSSTAGGSAGAAVTTSTLFGAAFDPRDAARFATLNGEFGNMQITRSYDATQGVGPFLNSAQALDIANNAVSAYSFKYLPKEVLAGTHDSDLKSFFAGIKDGHEVYWTYWHEPDDEIYKTHTFTAPDYRAAWAYIRKLADQERAKRPKLVIHATLIIMEYSMRPALATQRPLLGDNGMYPGDDVIEVFGVDAYNDTKADSDTQYGKVIDFAQQHGKPWALAETGMCPVATDPNAAATYLTNTLTYAVKRAYVPAYVTYFDIDYTNCDYTLDDNLPAQKVMHDAIANGIQSF